MECEDKHILYWDQTRTSRWVCCTHSWEPWALAVNSRGFKVLTESNSYLMIMCCMRCVILPQGASLWEDTGGTKSHFCGQWGAWSRAQLAAWLHHLALCDPGEVVNTSFTSVSWFQKSMIAFYEKSEELTDAMYLDTSRDVVDFLCCSVDFGPWERPKGGEGGSGAFVACLLLAHAPAFAENF